MASSMSFEDLTNNLRKKGLSPRSYSGRFMFGKECVAVVVSHPGEHELPSGWSMDNMGKDYVIYWRDVEWKRLSSEDRASMALETVEAMREVYEAEGEEEGDFDDAKRYLRDDASDEELREEHTKWTKLQKEL